MSTTEKKFTYVNEVSGEETPITTVTIDNSVLKNTKFDVMKEVARALENDAKAFGLKLKEK